MLVDAKGGGGNEADGDESPGDDGSDDDADGEPKQPAVYPGGRQNSEEGTAGPGGSVAELPRGAWAVLSRGTYTGSTATILGRGDGFHRGKMRLEHDDGATFHEFLESLWRVSTPRAYAEEFSSSSGSTIATTNGGQLMDPRSVGPAEKRLTSGQGGGQPSWVLDSRDESAGNGAGGPAEERLTSGQWAAETIASFIDQAGARRMRRAREVRRPPQDRRGPRQRHRARAGRRRIHQNCNRVPQAGRVRRAAGAAARCR